MSEVDPIERMDEDAWRAGKTAKRVVIIASTAVVSAILIVFPRLRTRIIRKRPESRRATTVRNLIVGKRARSRGPPTVRTLIVSVAYRGWNARAPGPGAIAIPMPRRLAVHSSEPTKITAVTSRPGAADGIDCHVASLGDRTSKCSIVAA
jgi:hypothetical protein